MDAWMPKVENNNGGGVIEVGEEMFFYFFFSSRDGGGECVICISGVELYSDRSSRGLWFCPEEEESADL
jgi:hypothetical protein